MVALPSNERLENQDRDQLLQTARRLLAEADALSSRIAAVNEIGIAINRTLDLNVIQRVIAKQAKWLLDFEHCSVCLQEDASWRLTTLFGPEEAPNQDWLAIENVGRALKTNQPQLIRAGSPSPFLSQYMSQIIIPLVADENILGTINFATNKAGGYTQDDMRIGYMLALQLAAAIRNARNFEELRKTRDALSKYATELEARNQELDAFSHTIAHDLKSPLNAISLKSELISFQFRDILPEEAKAYARGIHQGAMKMNEMIDQLLWLARLRNIQETVKPIDAAPVVSAALGRFTPVLETNRIAVEVGPQIPPALGHAQWLEEIFANLISNAIKYMGKDNPEPRITIRGTCDGKIVRYEVEDTGIGIKLENQAKLFEMFTRVNAIQVEGLGLGLSIVHRMVTKLSGQVGVHSIEGKGSTFWFTLPAANLSPVKHLAQPAHIETE
jgi:signal transduction histidine kinase